MSSDPEHEFAKLSIQDEGEDPYIRFNPLQRKGACAFYTFTPPYTTDFIEFPVEDLHLLSESHKLYLLRQYSRIQEKQTIKGSTILHRLHAIAPSTANLYQLKSTAIQDLTFRLLNQRHQPSVREKSYIALSYCWQQEPVPQSASYSPHDAATIPLSIPGGLFQAFANERISAEEGMWIDAVCIKQSSKQEKSISINAMDAIYLNARVVVCALWDIAITIAEERFLRAYICDFEDDKWDKEFVPHALETPPFFEQQPLLKDLFYKMLTSRWFTRAWCFHEMRLGQKHVFVLPCSGLLRDPSEQNVDKTYLGITAFFLWHLIRLSSEVPGVKSLHNIREALSMKLDIYQEMKKQARLASQRDIFPQTLRNEAGGEAEASLEDMYTGTMKTVFELGAGGNPYLPPEQRKIDAQHDKISILLNIVGNGLALRRNQPALTSMQDNVYYSQTMLLALAANDPVALCTDGRPLQFGAANEDCSWFCEPHAQDLGSDPLRNGPLPLLTSPLIALDPSPLRRWIELDMIFLGVPDTPSSICEETARSLTAKCISLKMGIAPGGIFSVWGVGPEYQYWRWHTDVTPGMREIFEATLACVLDCGLKWMLGTAKKCGYPKPDALRRAASQYFHEGFDNGELQTGAWTSSALGRGGVEAIFRFANWLASWRLQSTKPKTNERAVLYTHPCRGKTVVFTSIEPPCFAAIPVALVHDAYARLSRVWFLQHEGLGKDQGLDSAMPRFTLHRKARLFATYSAEDIVQAPKMDDRQSGRWILQSQVRVHGPMVVETRASDGLSYDEGLANTKEVVETSHPSSRKAAD